MNTTKKHILTALTIIVICTVLGVAIQYFFNQKLYSALFAGAVIAYVMSLSAKKRTTEKQ